MFDKQASLLGDNSPLKTNDDNRVNSIQKAFEHQFVKTVTKLEIEDSNDQAGDQSKDQAGDESKLQIEEEEGGDRTDREWETRDALPVERDPANKPSTWKMLKDMIGKDLSRFSIPVYFNEPLSFIQKFVEVLEQQELLTAADQMDDSRDRLMNVAAFAVSQYPSQDGRL